MSFKQLTVFVENQQGAVVDVTEALANADINLRALSIADTKDFGILRLVTNDNQKAYDILKNQGYLIQNTDVVGVKVSDVPGRLSSALKVLDEAHINLEYLYVFMAHTEKHAYVVLRVADIDAAEKALTDAGFHIVTDADILKLK